MNHDQRVAFWREVMQYAHDRGMKFYFFNWNIYVDYAKEQYPEITRRHEQYQHHRLHESVHEGADRDLS